MLLLLFSQVGYYKSCYSCFYCWSWVWWLKKTMVGYSFRVYNICCTPYYYFMTITLVALEFSDWKVCYYSICFYSSLHSIELNCPLLVISSTNYKHSTGVDLVHMFCLCQRLCWKVFSGFCQSMNARFSEAYSFVLANLLSIIYIMD